MIAYPINWRLTAEEIGRIVERAAPRLLLVDDSTLPLVADWTRDQSGYRLLVHRQHGCARLHLRDAVSHCWGAGPVWWHQMTVCGYSPLPQWTSCRVGGADAHQPPHGQSPDHGLYGPDRGGRESSRPPRFTPPWAQRWQPCTPGGANVVMTRFDAGQAVQLIDAHRVTYVTSFLPVPHPTPGHPVQMGSTLCKSQARLWPGGTR